MTNTANCGKIQISINFMEEKIMAYIQIELAGQKTFGGYLKIDGEKQIKLIDGLLIPVSAGTHYLDFSSESKSSRNMSKANAALGNYREAAFMERNSVDGEITVTLDENDLMTFTVVSDKKSRILGLPQYTVRELDESELETATAILNEQAAAFAGAKKKRKFIWGILVAALGVFGLFQGKETLAVSFILIAVGALLIFLGLSKKKRQQ
mgnify:FL=1